MSPHLRVTDRVTRRVTCRVTHRVTPKYAAWAVRGGGRNDGGAGAIG